MAITDFLEIDFPAKELAAALRIIRAFKSCENQEEWLTMPFIIWAKLEQLEEFLVHLVEGSPLKADTLSYIEIQKRKHT